MAKFWFLTHFLPLSLAAGTLAFDSNLIKAVPKSGRIAGVFMIPEGGRYIFNSTDARDACLFLNVTIATEAQMQNAIRHGLQLCRFGWMDGEVAVIPRTMGDPNCGKNKTGLVTWKAKADKLFGAFCFDAAAADLKSSTTMTGLTRASTAAASPVRSKPPSTWSTTEDPTPPPPTSAAPPPTSAAPPPVQSTPTSTRFSSTSPLLKSISSAKPSLCPPVASSTSVTSTAAPSASVQASTSSVSWLRDTVNVTGDSVLLQSTSPAQASLGAVPTALLVLGLLLLFLTAAGVAWFYKLKRCVFPFWSRGQQKDDVETEMWKHTDSEMDLHSHQGEEEEPDRKYSSDITLCVNPDIKTNSSE